MRKGREEIKSTDRAVGLKSVRAWTEALAEDSQQVSNAHGIRVGLAQHMLNGRP